MAKVGRPVKDIDWNLVDNACLMHATEAEIAGLLDINIDTLAIAIRKEFDMTFPEYFAIKSAGGKMSLRRKQYTKAMEGNVTMQIWLGKQWLGQSDKMESKQEITGANGGAIKTEAVSISAEELAKAKKLFDESY
jgi:hypothetical protein